MSDTVNKSIPQDLQGDWAQAQIDRVKPWHFMQILPSKVIGWIERIAKAEAELAQEKETGFATSAALEAERERAMQAVRVVADLQLQVVAKDQRFEEHTKAVGKFLSDMYATMIDPLEQGDLKVSEMCEMLLNAASENRQALQDQIDRAGNLPANWKDDSSLETWFPITAEELKSIKAQLSQAQQLIAKLSAPVTDEEWDAHSYWNAWAAYRGDVDALLAARRRREGQ